MSTTYSPPIITAAGLSIPTYPQILALALAKYQSVYGGNVYLGIDSSDYQWISVVSSFLSDCMQGIQLSYNSRGPGTAIGAALDGVVKLNGLVRLSAGYSTCLEVITGNPGTVITSGVMTDVNGFQWNLPSPTTIPSGGTLTVQLTAVQAGPINANPGDISIISTPTAGWISGTNTVAAVAGNAIEKDSILRARQAISVALPSVTRLAGTVAGLEQTSGVTRVNVLENQTAAVDANGLPSHSICAVVEGGTDLAVATTIFENKGIGCLTFGSVSLNIVDPDTGFLTLISFDRPTYIQPYVTVNLKALTGFTSATLTAIQSALVTYLNALETGSTVVYGELWGAALSANPNPYQPIYAIQSIFSSLTASPTGTADLPLLFNQVSTGVAGNIVVNSI